MSESTLIALLSLLGVLGAAGITWLTAAQARTSKKLDRLARENQALWYYTRHLIDWGYRPRKPGELPPEPPETVKHLYEFGD